MNHVAAVDPADQRVHRLKMTGPGRALATVIIVGLALAGRLTSGWNAPLWFDETFSAVIASQPSPSSLIQWCLNEVGGPVYYLLLWVWAHVFGIQSTALRSFSLLCSLAAPLAAWRLGPSSHMVRLYWAALLALWVPVFDYASDARCYALLLLINTLQAIAFLRLLSAPTRRHALAWTTLSVLGILTHYQTTVLAGVQGVVFLAMHRREAVRCWPALLALIPMAGWMALHLPLLLRFAASGTWYSPITPLDLMLAPASFFVSIPIGMVLGLGGIITAIARWRGWPIDTAPAPERALAFSGLLAMAIILLISMIKPSFTWRYAVVCAPAILFAVAIWVQTLKPRLALAPAVVLAMLAALAASHIAINLRYPASNYRFAFNLDQPSRWLGEGQPRRLGFLWDSPTGRMSGSAGMTEIAGFFLRQAGHPVSVSVLKAWPGTDPRRLVADQIGRGAIDSLIWISDSAVAGTLAKADGRALVRAGWQCRNFGLASNIVLACRPAQASLSGAARPRPVASRLT